ncbi:MAG TPA: DegV family protein [Anaerolineae bacterium]|jgi:DegV family protein with EDD domain|nr:DegV family protein [Anaerolineae bacterium]
MQDRARIAVVTDSTSDIPRSLVESTGIQMMPQVLIMGNRTWRDGVDIDPPTFYELLRTSSAFPSSSQASMQDFYDLFRRVGREYEGIVAIVVSSKLSGTINSAQAAAAEIRDLPIEVIDSRAASMQLGFIALAAARTAATGAGLEAVAAAARKVIEQVRIYFVVDTLEYLHRGGRIGLAARLFGTALNLKPVLTVTDGVVTPVARIRSRRKALDHLYSLLDEDLAGADPERVHMAVLHVAAPREGAELAARVEARFHPGEMIVGDCGPVVGAHVGPGTMGMAYYVEGA